MRRFWIDLLLISVWLVGVAKAADDARFVAKVGGGVICESASETAPDFSSPQCRKAAIAEIDPQGRVIWAQFRVDIPQPVIASGKPMALYFGALASSTIYWNGQLIGSNGAPGSNRKAEIPGKLDTSFFVPPTLLAVGENIITVKTASFHNPVRVGRPVHYLYVAQARLGASLLALHYAPALLTAGAFVLTALYFGILAWRSRDGGGAALIAVMAIFAGAQLFVESLRAFIAYDYPWQIWRLIAVALCSASFALALAAYIARRFQPERWRLFFIAAIVMTVPAAVFAPGFDAKALLGLTAPSLAALAAVAAPALRGQAGARLTAGALIAFLTLIFIDGQNFLDRTFYFAAAIVTIAVFIDQARTMHAEKTAREEFQARAERLELELLRRRIAPHFLMNTLNALVEWVESNPQTGVKMIESLAEEFRILSQISNRAVVPLSEELALCRRHLEVMSFRVDREFSLATENVDERLEIPPGVIHTLIENAFTHCRYAQSALFCLRQTSEGELVTLVLETPAGEASPVKNKEQGGAGIAYVVRRLRAAFGASAKFEDGPSDSGGWRSVLQFEERTG